MSQDLVEKLIRGSENIDRMRKQIDFVVRMILGFVAPIVPWHGDTVCERFRGPACEWQIFKTSSSELEVTCRLVVCARSTQLIYAFNPNPKNFPEGAPFLLENVQIVYNNLGLFAEGMSAWFPHLHNRWKPLLDAA